MFPPNPSLKPSITVDSIQHVAVLRDGRGDIELRLNYATGCVVDRLRVRGVEAVGAGGLHSGIQIGERWHVTTELARPPRVSQSGDRLRVTGIQYGDAQISVDETWTFLVKRDGVDWRIDRRYKGSGLIANSAMPAMEFASMQTWTGALLGTGGVAWGKLLDQTQATYGVHAESCRFWNPTTDICLQVAIKSKAHAALQFTRQPGEFLSASAAITQRPLAPKYDLSRFQRSRTDIWRGFTVESGEQVSATYELRASGYRDAYSRGDFRGLDTDAITELLNTIGRVGVIDGNLVGSNGWYSGYICMHEPWLARVGTAINDPHYTDAVARFLDYAREHAIGDDGMVKSRWKYDGGDAQPGTYNPETGFYEAQWGRLMDSQSSYVTNVADQFDASGDRDWVSRQRASVERTLDYLLRRDTDGDGLVEMENTLTSQRRSSDWLDIVWAGHENAFVNAQLYGALVKWAGVESVLGDEPKARRYRDLAARLKSSFNKPISDGGFWNPDKGWYVYWRDADGTVHGDNLVIPVNLTAATEGICDDPVRRERLLATIESRMGAESLLSWPACFDSYAPGEGADDTFPKYENGDIFLAWAEYGVKAYASTHPEIALKYVRQIVDQYKKDGLAFQRYLRADVQGAGDDILANNCNVMTGLYREIFGIQPRHNRLYLEPHLSPELNGISVLYNLRGRPLSIRLAMGDYAVQSQNLTVQATEPFGVDFLNHGLTYFAHDAANPALTISESGKAGVRVGILTWDARRQWKLEVTQPVTLRHEFHDLRPGIRYVVRASGVKVGEVTADRPALAIRCRPGLAMDLEVAAD